MSRSDISMAMAPSRSMRRKVAKQGLPKPQQALCTAHVGISHSHYQFYRCYTMQQRQESSRLNPDGGVMPESTNHYARGLACPAMKILTKLQSHYLAAPHTMHANTLWPLAWQTCRCKSETGHD